MDNFVDPIGVCLREVPLYTLSIKPNHEPEHLSGQQEKMT